MREPQRIGDLAATAFRDATSASKTMGNCSIRVDEIVLCARCGRNEATIVAHAGLREFKVCPECYHRRQAHRQYARERNQIIRTTVPVRYRDAHFRRISGEVVERMTKARTGMVLYGPPGTGKTYAACAYLRWWIVTRLRRPVRTTWDRLLLEIRSCFKDGATKSELDTIKPYMEADLLVLEDIGATTGMATAESDFSLRVLMVILDYRIENMLPTCITTNKTRESFGKSFNPRIASRLHLMTWIGIGGGDKREGDK